MLGLTGSNTLLSALEINSKEEHASERHSHSAVPYICASPDNYEIMYYVCMHACMLYRSPWEMTKVEG